MIVVKREEVLMGNRRKRLAYANTPSEPEKRWRSPARRRSPAERLTSVITAEDVVPFLRGRSRALLAGYKPPGVSIGLFEKK